MNYPIDAILVMGKYAAGKTDFTSFLMDRLPQEESIRRPITFSSDRIFIEEQVIQDVWRDDAPVKGREGAHSILYKPLAEPGFREFGVKDGTLHRFAHKAMVEGIRYKKNPSLQVLEIGIGPDVEIKAGQPILLQSGDHFLRLFRDDHIMDSILVVEVEASYPVRLERNASRGNPVPENIFLAAARDGDEFYRADHGLGHRHILFPNETNDTSVFLREAEQIVSERIVPYIREEGVNILPEGQKQGPPFRFER